ncbi:hypothetical protein FF36_05081 [Frankia torreyi]|uniref:Uncharacterized protein n=1 Tax=Frankia torreyi TaxID=1856 RepID=A0A0D8B8P7_9ACTN|nr:hypothetical protein FF36_05081 [Frankia torreyi]KQM02946.1 hypothetical protein FF86_105244 [Frankia sp. CpI1-P]
MPTRSPTAKPVTPAPSSATAPAISWPSTIGTCEGMPGTSPFMKEMSVWHSPAA